MSVQERSGTLFAAAALRVPRLESGASPRERIEALETYLLDVAHMQGELEQARLDTHDALRHVEGEWEDLQGWEMLRRGKTDRSIDDAKRQLRPELWDAICKARWLIARLTEQIERLERDATKVSRAYTLMTGS